MTSSESSTRRARTVEAAPSDEPSSEYELVREIAHDLNGALNSLVLNIQLLDLTTNSIGRSEHAAKGRARSLAAMRRAAREMQEIVERRLLAVGRRTAAS